jgi:putative transposase
MLRCLLWAIAAAVRPKILLIADNLCLRQQLLVLKRQKPRPRLKDADRRFWVLACRWFLGWQSSVLIVKPETVLRWHRHGWRTYWRRRSSCRAKTGRCPIAPELRTLIRRMASENRLWGQRRIQGELSRLGFKVSARTVAKYMRRAHRRGPSSRWRSFLSQHASTVWACDFFCVQTITFRTLYVFFVIHHASRQVLHVQVTPYPTARWTAQQIVECCNWDCHPPRFLVHDRDNCYAASFNRRVRNLGIMQARTPFRSPRANATAERWVRSVRTECLDHVFIFNEHHLQKVLAEYVGYFNHWRPHRSIGQRAPCAPATEDASHQSDQAAKFIGVPVLGGLHHVYQQAA